MSTKIWISGIALSLGVAVQGAAQSCLDEARDAHPNAPATQALFCMDKLQGELAETRAELEAVNSVLKHAVLAFNRSEKKGGACPRGWSLFEAAGGRMIVGTGEHRNAGLSEYPSFADDPRDATGGAESVKLTEAQMPRHDHGDFTGDAQVAKGGVNFWYDLAGPSNHRFQNSGGVGADNTQQHVHGIQDSGASQPHPNMPPYIALYFCKKD